MSETETEIDALDRLESALGRIAAHAAASRIKEQPSDEAAVAAVPGRDVAAALDRVIGQLRAVLAAVDEAEQH